MMKTIIIISYVLFYVGNIIRLIIITTILNIPFITNSVKTVFFLLSEYFMHE